MAKGKIAYASNKDDKAKKETNEDITKGTYELRLNGGVFLHYKHRGKKRKVNITKRVNSSIIDRLKDGLEEITYTYLRGDWVNEHFKIVETNIGQHLYGIESIAEQEITRDIRNN